VNHRAVVDSDSESTLAGYAQGIPDHLPPQPSWIGKPVSKVRTQIIQLNKMYPSV
jgi:hypothetical protein